MKLRFLLITAEQVEPKLTEFLQKEAPASISVFDVQPVMFIDALGQQQMKVQIIIIYS